MYTTMGEQMLVFSPAPPGPHETGENVLAGISIHLKGTFVPSA
jgi:hypothetical protein